MTLKRQEYTPTIRSAGVIEKKNRTDIQKLADIISLRMSLMQAERLAQVFTPAFFKPLAYWRAMRVCDSAKVTKTLRTAKDGW